MLATNPPASERATALEGEEGETTNAPVATGDQQADTSATARAAFTKSLADAYTARGGRFLEHGEPLFMHGALHCGPIKKPRVLWKSDQKPRRDHDASSWLTATEFEDQPDVMLAKVKRLGELMRVSKRTVVYTGAGISASAVGQAALSGCLLYTSPSPRDS